jgi:hypothetical protein
MSDLRMSVALVEGVNLDGNDPWDRLSWLQSLCRLGAVETELLAIASGLRSARVETVGADLAMIAARLDTTVERITRTLDGDGPLTSWGLVRRAGTRAVVNPRIVRFLLSGGRKPASA